jgi:uncharacterized protein YwbE
MASDRASYTAEDVLDLLHDVETNIREGGWHFAASVGMRSDQCDMAQVAPTGDIQHSTSSAHLTRSDTTHHGIRRRMAASPLQFFSNNIHRSPEASAR